MDLARVPAHWQEARLLASANTHLAYLYADAASRDDSRALVGGVVTVAVWTYRTALSLGIDLDKALDAKMVVNRGRQWKLDGSGCGYHVRKDEGALLAEATFPPGTVVQQGETLSVRLGVKGVGDA